MTARIGVSFQAYYQRQRERRSVRILFQEEIILSLVSTIRSRQPRCGTRKLLFLIRDDLVRLDYRLGRDALFDLLRREGMLVRPRKRRPYTTLSDHRLFVYPNLVEDMQLISVGQLLVADITYLRVGEGFCYLSLVTDAFSRMIVGWELSDSLDASGTMAALALALRNTPIRQRTVHHSDRGVQYCSGDYTSILAKAGIRISMGRTGCPQDNAVAERVNGILKGEFLLDQNFSHQSFARHATKSAIEIYNHERPHLSLQMLTPAQVFFKKSKHRPTCVHRR